MCGPSSISPKHHDSVATISPTPTFFPQQARWSALGLTRRQKGLALVLSLAGLWSLVSWPTRLTAVLAGALAIRANLRPTEVEAIMSHAAPYTQSVQKRARRLSIAAAGFASSRLGRHVKPRQL